MSKRGTGIRLEGTPVPPQHSQIPPARHSLLAGISSPVLQAVAPGFRLFAGGMEIWKLYLDVFSILQQQGCHGDAGKDEKVGTEGERKLRNEKCQIPNNPHQPRKVLNSS